MKTASDVKKEKARLTSRGDDVPTRKVCKGMRGSGAAIGAVVKICYDIRRDLKLKNP